MPAYGGRGEGGPLAVFSCWPDPFFLCLLAREDDQPVCPPTHSCVHRNTFGKQRCTHIGTAERLHSHLLQWDDTDLWGIDADANKSAILWQLRIEDWPSDVRAQGQCCCSPDKYKSQDLRSFVLILWISCLNPFWKSFLSHYLIRPFLSVFLFTSTRRTVQEANLIFSCFCARWCPSRILNRKFKICFTTTTITTAWSRPVCVFTKGDDFYGDITIYVHMVWTGSNQPKLSFFFSTSKFQLKIPFKILLIISTRVSSCGIASLSRLCIILSVLTPPSSTVCTLKAVFLPQ